MENRILTDNTLIDSNTHTIDKALKDDRSHKVNSVYTDFYTDKNNVSLTDSRTNIKSAGSGTLVPPCNEPFKHMEAKYHKQSIIHTSNTSYTLQEKLSILSDAAKYDVACTSSGVDRNNDGTGLGNAVAGGICHAFTADGRCVSLLKILMTNECSYNCKYCVNRVTSDVRRATFTPEEICTLVIEFYRRNYIEGLFLSSGVIGSPNQTMELICYTLFKLRFEHNFQGYIHVKAIPGADLSLIQQLGYLADRMSVNLEFPTAEGLKELAPNKTRKMILEPMKLVQGRLLENRHEIAIRAQYRDVPGNLNRSFVPAGQSTQMIIGATPETDYQIINVAESLYDRFSLKRVFYSAYISTYADATLPSLSSGPPMLREHRLYQADWLLRFYNFKAHELLSEDTPNFNVFLDPKCNWALHNLGIFPVEINKASKHTLLRVPGIGVQSAERIIGARRFGQLDFQDLKKMGVVLKRALYFITCNGKMMYNTPIEEDFITRNLMSVKERLPDTVRDMGFKQLSLFDTQGFVADEVGIETLNVNDLMLTG